MISIGINGKDYKIPTSFDEIDLGTYCRVFSGLENTDGLDGSDLFFATRHNEAKIISRLMGENDDFCMDMPLPIYGQLAESVSFIYGLAETKHSQFIEIDGRRYTVPEPEQMNLRQWIDIDMTSTDDSMPDDGEKYLRLLAVMLVEVGEDGKPVAYKGEDKSLYDKLKKVKASDGLGIVYHFFLRGAISSTISQAYSKVEEAMSQLRQSMDNS